MTSCLYTDFQDIKNSKTLFKKSIFIRGSLAKFCCKRKWFILISVPVKANRKDLHGFPENTPPTQLGKANVTLCKITSKLPTLPQPTYITSTKYRSGKVEFGLEGLKVAQSPKKHKKDKAGLISNIKKPIKKRIKNTDSLIKKTRRLQGFARQERSRKFYKSGEQEEGNAVLDHHQTDNLLQPSS